MTDLIELPDGSKINSDGVVVEDSKPRRNLIATSNKRKDDLPANGKTYAVIAALELWGLPLFDVAEVLDIPIERIRSIVHSDKYDEFRHDLIDGVLLAETDDVRQIFIARSKDAAKGITNLMDSSIPEVKMFAMKETLDRGGFRPADIVEHRHKVEGALRIVHVKDESKTIDVDFTEVGEEDGNNS